MPGRQPLPSVTLCCVDTRHAAQAWYALERSTHALSFGSVVFFCPHDWEPCGKHNPEIKQHPIPAIQSIEGYNRFMLQELAPHIDTSHVLVMQWDGFIADPKRWDDEFLSWDYIGAPWYHGGSSGSVGNGGFSLRSRKLLNALAHLDHNDGEPEDMAICVTLRPRLEAEFGVKFAPLEVAQRFAHEYGPVIPAFGFHGMHNFAHVMSPDELRAWLATAPDDLLCTKHARKLIKTLMASRQAGEAQYIIQRRSATLGWTVDQCLLWLRTMAWRLRGAIA